MYDWSLSSPQGGIELMHMIAKGQMRCHDGNNPSDAQQFYSLAA